MTTMYDHATRCVIVCLAILPWLGSASAPGNEPKANSSTPAATEDSDEMAGDRYIVACCFINDIPAPECIPGIDDVDCLALDGVPLSSCGPDTCNLGSCCVGSDPCEDAAGQGISYAECVDTLGGTYFGGTRCADGYACPSCPITDDNKCQPHTGTMMVPIDRRLGVRTADGFAPWGAGGTIDRVCWWPCWFNPALDQSCADDAVRPPDDFIIRWYQDGGGIPGAEVGTIGGEPLWPDIRVNIPGSPCLNYSAPLTTPLSVDGSDCYWIEITGYGDDATGCTVYWANSNTRGDYLSVFDEDGHYGPEDFQTALGDERPDLAYCLSHSFSSYLYSCQDRSACCVNGSTCDSYTQYQDCVDAGGEHVFGQSCADNPCAPACENDDCANAFELTGPGPPCYGSLYGCQLTYNTYACDGASEIVPCQAGYGVPPAATPLGPDIWYTIRTYGGRKPLMIGVSPDTSTGTALAIYDGGADCSVCPDDTATPIVCREDSQSAWLEAYFCPHPDHCYFIRVAGTDRTPGMGSLTLDGALCYCCPDIPLNRPMPDYRFSLDGAARPCQTDADCAADINPNSETSCILPPGGQAGDGACYVHRNRYLSFKPALEPDPWRPWAYRVSLDEGGEYPRFLGWVADPIEIVTGEPGGGRELLARLIPSEFDQYNAYWDPADTIHIGDCAISPGQTYIIEALYEDCDWYDESNYSEPLVLETVSNFGDVVGATVGDPPDGVRNFRDISAVVRGFQNIQTEPRVWLDLQGGTAAPEIPDFSDINFADINHAVSGFQGATYPFAAPCDCPDQNCTPLRRDGARRGC